MSLDVKQGRARPIRARRRVAVVQRASRLKQALCASLLLHVGAIFLLFYLEFDIRPVASPPEDPDRFVLTLTQFNPQRRRLPEPLVAEVLPQPAAPEGEQNTQTAIVEEDSPGNVIDSGEEEAGERAAGTVEAEITSNSDDGLDAAVLRNAVSAYIDTTYRRGLGASWVENCLRYKNQHGTSDCPQNARNGATPVKRSEQNYLAVSQYLNPNGLQVIAGESIVPIVQFGGGRLVFLSGLLTLSLTGEITWKGDRVLAPPVPFRPYRTEAVRPPDREPEGGFVRQTPLFPLRR